MQAETKECDYNASDAASGGLSVRVNFRNPRGGAYFTSLESAYSHIPDASTNLQPGDVWSPPSLVKNLGGDEGFVALDRGGAYTWAATSGTACVVIQIGGTAWLHSSAGANVNADVFKLMKLALPPASAHQSAS